mgnify:FL=1
MEKTTLHVEGMSCQHCVKAVTGALSALPGVAFVSVDLACKAVAVEYDPAKTSTDQLKAEIEDQGYDVIA